MRHTGFPQVDGLSTDPRGLGRHRYSLISATELSDRASAHLVLLYSLISEVALSDHASAHLVLRYSLISAMTLSINVSALLFCATAPQYCTVPLLGYGQNIQYDWNINAAEFKNFYPLTHQGSHAFHKNRRKGKRNLPLVDRFVKPSKSVSWFIRIFKGAAFLKSDHPLQVSTHEQ